VLGCLLYLSVFVVGTVGAAVLTNSSLLGLFIGWGTLLGVISAEQRLRKVRHERLMRKWAADQHLSEVTIKAESAFIDPEPMPWWMAWAAYRLRGADANGKQCDFRIFITGVLATFRLRMSVTTDADYIALTADDFSGRPLHTVPLEELDRMLQEKRYGRTETPHRSPQ
jgi:hypothetical protein